MLKGCAKIKKKNDLSFSLYVGHENSLKKHMVEWRSHNMCDPEPQTNRSKRLFPYCCEYVFLQDIFFLGNDHLWLYLVYLIRLLMKLVLYSLISPFSCCIQHHTCFHIHYIKVSSIIVDYSGSYMVLYLAILSPV